MVNHSMEYVRAEQKVLWAGISHVSLESNLDKYHVHIRKKIANLIAYLSISLFPNEYTNTLVYRWCWTQK